MPENKMTTITKLQRSYLLKALNGTLRNSGMTMTVQTLVSRKLLVKALEPGYVAYPRYDITPAGRALLGENHQ